MPPETAVTLCVLLWARAGEADALIAYEDAVLQLVATHGGRVLQRARTDGENDAPLEIHSCSSRRKMRSTRTCTIPHAPRWHRNAIAQSRAPTCTV